MENDQRLTPLPKAADLHLSHHEYAGYSGFYDDEAIENKRSLQQYFNVVYKRLPIILALTILVTAAAAFYMYRQPSMFEAQTQMIIEPRRPKPQAKDSININFGEDYNYYNTQLRLLQSPDLMKEVVIKLGLYRDANLLSQDRGILATLRNMFSGGPKPTDSESTLPIVSGDDSAGTSKLSPQEDQLAEMYVSTLIGGSKVEQQERTNIVNITIQSTNPELAAKVSHKMAEVFIDDNADREMKGSADALKELKKSIDDLKSTLKTEEEDLVAKLRDAGLPLVEKGQDLAAARLQSLGDSWLKSQDNRRQLEARYNAAIQANGRGEAMNIPDISESKMVQDAVRLNAERRDKLQDQINDIDAKITAAETEKAELLVKYTPEYSKVKEVERRISALNDAKKKAQEDVAKTISDEQKKIERDSINGALVSLRAQLDAAKRTEAQAEQAYNAESAKANVQGQAATELITLKRKIDTDRTLLDSYSQQLQEAQLAYDGSRPDNIKIPGETVVPTAPVGPQRGRNIFVAFLVSLIAGIGLAFLMDYLDDSVKSSDDVSRHLALPTLALIPHYAATEKRRLGLPASSSEAPSAGLITIEDARSPMAEAYRHLRTSLLFSSAGKPPQTILVTSSQPSEGKTTTAINTAITLAQADADVVIIDCDLRRPRIHNYFGLENTVGLTNYLSGDRNTENLIRPYAELPRLKVITSGPIPPNPTELLSSNEMKNLLQFLSGRFKHVIIDSPPAISFTDAAILSTQVDGVVLVAMAGKSSIHLMRRFKQRLGNIGARIYGVVINGIKSGSLEYEYYGAGYYNYYKASDLDDSTPMLEDVSPNGRSKE